MTAEAARPPAPGPPSPAIRNVVVGAAVGFFVLAIIGDLFLPVLFDQQPQLFIALNARTRNLAVAQPYLEWWEFFGIATARLLASDPLFFLLGRWYGDAGVRWIEKRSATYGPMARTAERWFGKAAYPLVVIAPNNYVCLFAGAGGMSVPVFIVLNVAGTIGRLVLLWFLTDAFADLLDWPRHFIADNRLPFLAVTFGLVLISLWTDRRVGGTELEGLLHIEDELEHGEDGIEPDTAADDDGATTPDA